MINIDKKYTNIHSKDFRCGWEIECLIKSRFNESFKSEIRQLNRNIDIGTDGSLEADKRDRMAFAYEIRTNPSYPFNSLINLGKIFELIDSYGFVNKTCGLHLNVSPVSDEIYEKVNPFYIAKSKLWAEIKKNFNRQRNQYCKLYNFKGLKKKLTLLDIWQKDMQHASPTNGDSHYRCCNFDNYHIPRRKDSRIELRVFGNEAYHKKFDLIINYTNQALEVIKEGYQRGKEIEI